MGYYFFARHADWQKPNAGWHAPETSPALEAALQKASQAYFGAPAVYLDYGGALRSWRSSHVIIQTPSSSLLVCGVNILTPTGPMNSYLLPLQKRSQLALPVCCMTGASTEDSVVTVQAVTSALRAAG